MPRGDDYGRDDLTTARREFNATIDRLTEAVAKRRRLDAEVRAATTVDRAKLEQSFPAMKGRA